MSFGSEVTYHGDPHYICKDCALEKKAVWPDVHCATMHSDKCFYCGKEKGLCSIDDWDWPKGSQRPPRKYGAGRD